MAEPSWKRSFMRRFRDFDVFARMLKVQDDLQVPTVSGGLLSVAATLLIVVLVATETISFLTKDRVQNLTVDPGRNEKLRIHFDLVRIWVSCAAPVANFGAGLIQALIFVEAKV